MDALVQEFARQLLRKLQLRTTETHPQKDSEMDISPDKNESVNVSQPKEDSGVPKVEDRIVEDNQSSEDLVHTPYLPERIEIPAKKDQVLQHVELLFALSVKVPEFLDEYVHIFMVVSIFLLLSYKNIHCLWKHGPNCPRSHSRSHYSAYPFAWFEPWETFDPYATMSSRGRISCS